LGWFHYRAEVIAHFNIFHYATAKKIIEVDTQTKGGRPVAEELMDALP